MKNILLLIVSLLLLMGSAFSQCPPGFFKFQGPLCEKPANATIKELNCSTLEVKWKGSKDQTYIVKAGYLDVATGKVTTVIDEWDIVVSCTGAGHCTAVIPVTAGSTITWNVQAKCPNGIYSDTLQGKAVTIPVCDEKSTSIHLYPNPTTGNISVEYLGYISGPVQFSVYDMSGKKIFGSTEVTTSGVNATFHFDLAGFAPGVYFLQARSEATVKTVKFMIE